MRRVVRCLRVGIFGVGRMVRVHLEHLVRLHATGGIELVAIGDRWPPFLEAARAQVPHADWVAAGLMKWPSTTVRTPPSSCRAPAITRAISWHSPVGGSPCSWRNRSFARSRRQPLSCESSAPAAIGSSRSRFSAITIRRDPSRRRMDFAGLIGSLQQSHHVLQDENPTPVVLRELRHHRRHGDSPGPRGDELSRFQAAAPRAGTAVHVAAVRGPCRREANIVHVFCQWPADRSRTCGDRGSMAPATTTALR